MNHDYLTKRAEKWLRNTKGCKVVFREFGGQWEIPDALGFKLGEPYHTILVECKASRSDFLSDKKKPFRKNPYMGMGDFRYYMCPKGLLKPEEMPENWGLLWVGEKIVKVKKTATKQENYSSLEVTMLLNALNRLTIQGYFERVYVSPWVEADHRNMGGAGI